MLYFAYGSNMCAGRLKARVSSAKLVTIAQLYRYRFAFEKRSDDGSAKGNAAETGHNSDFVWGVVFDLDPAGKVCLDKAEGLGHGYEERTVAVVNKSKCSYDCVTYCAATSHIVLDRPYGWYKQFVVEGARQHSLPQEYIDEKLAKPADKPDPNKQRDARNRKIKC